MKSVADQKISNFERQLITALKCLKHPDRFKIAKILKETREPLSYSDIKGTFRREYNDGKFWQHLRNLLDAQIIENDKKLFTDSTNKKVECLFTN